MTLLRFITLACLVLAMLFTFAAEKTPASSGSRGKRWAVAALFCGYGVCVGVLALIIEYLFQCPEWAALAIALPLGFPALLLAGKMGEA